MGRNRDALSVSVSLTVTPGTSHSRPHVGPVLVGGCDEPDRPLGQPEQEILTCRQLGTRWHGEEWDHEIGAVGRRNKKVARAAAGWAKQKQYGVALSEIFTFFLEPPQRNESFPGRLGGRRHRSILSHSVAGMAP